MDKIKLERPTIVRSSNKIERLKRPPKGKEWPRFEAMFDPEGRSRLDDIEMSGDAELDAQAEYDDVERDFMDNVRVEGDPYRTALDPEFYFVVCFQSRKQKDEFLALSGIGVAVGGDKYIDGLKLARHLGVAVEPIPLAVFKNKKTPRLLRDTRIIKRGGDINP